MTAPRAPSFPGEQCNRHEKICGHGLFSGRLFRCGIFPPKYSSCGYRKGCPDVPFSRGMFSNEGEMLMATYTRLYQLDFLCLD